MQTYLIVSQEKNFILDEIAKLKKESGVSPFNLHEIIPSPSIGIENIRNLQKIFIIKPFGGQNRLVIFYNMEKATKEAQNALLKVLEEPPKNTQIVLTVPNREMLLPTIVSRCQIITQQNPKVNNNEMIKETGKLLKQIFAASPSGRIALSQKLTKSKEDVLTFLEALIITLENYLHHLPDELKISLKEIAVCLSKTIAAKKYVELNTNYKATLDILFLGFPGAD
jgi:DNA polymerase-3 subunit delta'